MDDFKRKEKQGDRSKIVPVKEVYAFTFAQTGFFFFLLPDVLAAQITHLEEQCSKKL